MVLSTGMNLWDPQVWGFITTFSALLIAMIIAALSNIALDAVFVILLPDAPKHFLIRDQAEFFIEIVYFRCRHKSSFPCCGASFRFF